MLEPLMTVAEVAKMTRLGLSSVYALVQRGEIPHIKIGARIVFDPAIVRGWLGSLQSGTQPRT